MSDNSPIYSTMADDPILGEIVELFISELPERVTALQQQAQSEDWEGLLRTAHQLKGALGSHGFDQMTPVAQRLDQALRQGAEKQVMTDALTELVGLCRRVQPGLGESTEPNEPASRGS